MVSCGCSDTKVTSGGSSCKKRGGFRYSFKSKSKSRSKSKSKSKYKRGGFQYIKSRSKSKSRSKRLKRRSMKGGAIISSLNTAPFQGGNSTGISGINTFVNLSNLLSSVTIIDGSMFFIINY